MLRTNNLAWWDGELWSTEGLVNGNGDTSQYGNTTPVLSLAIRSDTIFLSHLGAEWHYEPAMRHATMLVNGTWEPCGSPEDWFWFLEANGRMFNGGRSDTLYGTYMPMVNEWVNGAWVPLPNSPFNNTGSIYDVTFWQGAYYFVGSFVAGSARSVIRFDGLDTWSVLAGGIGGNFTETVCGYGDSLFVGGYFLPGENVQSKHVQLWDGSTWKPFFSQVEYVGVVRDMQVYDGALYISGIYKWVGGTTWYGLLRYDGHTLCSIGGPMPGGDNGDMAFFQDYLYLGLAAQFMGMEGQGIGRLHIPSMVPDTCITVSSTGMAPPPNGQALHAYPNPVRDVLHLDLQEGVTEAEIRILDATGRAVRTLLFNGRQQLTLDLSDLSPGSYAVTLREAIGKLWSTRIIKLQ